MGIISEFSKSIYQATRPKRLPKQSKLQPKQEIQPDVIPFYPSATYSLPEPASKDAKAQLEAYSSWVYSCATVRAQKLATVNLQLYKKSNSEDPIEVKKHEVLDLLYSINPFCTFYDLIELTGLYLDLAGEAFWWLLRDKKGQIIQIYPYLSPENMEISTSATKYITGYIYNVPGSGQKIPFESKDILHFKYANPLNPYRGLSPVKAAELAIATDKEASIYNWRFFKNSAVPAGTLTTDKMLDDRTYQRIRAQWDAAHKGVNNAFRTAILEAGTKYANMGISQKDLEFLEGKKFHRDEILAMFRVPKSILGITEDVNRANAEATIAMFMEHVIEPNMRKVVIYLNEFLLPNYSDDIFFDFDNPVKANQEMELAYYQNGIANGWLTPNEIREWEGLDAIEGGDSVRQPFSSPLQLSDKPKNKKKFQIDFKRPTLGEKISSLLEPEIKKKIKKIISKKNIEPIKNESTKKPYDEKFADYIHKNKIAKTDEEEKQMMVKLRKEFDRQKKETLAQLNQKSVSDVDFDEEGEADIFAKIFEPEFEQFWKTHGDDAMRLIGLEFIDMTPLVRKKIKEQAAKFAEDVNETTAKKIKNQLQLGLDEGESIPELSERIKEVFAEATTSRAENISRTEVSKAVGDSSIEAWDQSGIVDKKQWITAKDERVCEICAPLDGEVIELHGKFKGDELFGAVESEPLHCQCRCDTVPIVE